MIQIFGIKNCNTVKKSLTWLDEHHIPYQFHDFKKEGVTLNKLQEWENLVPWENLVNKKGLTWKKLTKEQQEAVTDSASANAVLIENTSMIKRPVIEINGQLILGFDEDEYAQKITAQNL